MAERIFFINNYLRQSMKKVNNVKMFAEKTDFFKREICLFLELL
jgi:hypothetical protein